MEPEITGAKEYAPVFNEILDKVIEEYDPEYLPSFRISTVKHPAYMKSALDAENDVIEMRVFPEALDYEKFDRAVMDMLKFSLSKYQLLNKTPLSDLEGKVLGNEDMVDSIKKITRDYEKNQEYAIHEEEKRAFRYLGKLCFDITNHINENFSNQDAYDYGVLVRLRGFDENLARATAGFPGYKAPYILDISKKQQPLGIDLGDGNKQIEFLRKELEEKGWKELLDNWNRSFKRAFIRHPSYDPMDER